ncbi:MAG: hypothetical protein JXR95_01120 [Deltaproteobacteria bacterium]|nr:hypothetical protein [Deltaproteobacteria bacterium]
MRHIFITTLIFLSIYTVNMSVKAQRLQEDEGFVSIHALELENHRNIEPPIRIYPENTGFKGKYKNLTKIVYGYLPYWISDVSQFRWQDLTHIAYFSVEVQTDGTLGDRRGWPDNALVNTAHSNGVKVELVFTLMSSSAIENVLSVTSTRHDLVIDMVDEMELGGADGINIDFEFVSSTAGPYFTTFLEDIRSELDSRGLFDSTISMAGPAVDWSGGVDLPAIIDTLDLYFIMAYDYFYSGSSIAGPSGIFRTTSAWSGASTRNVLRSVAAATSEVGEANRHKIIAGLPYYGREWITSSGTWPSSVVSHVGTVTYANARSMLSSGSTRSFDDGICNSAIIWQQSGAWHQAWYEDEYSLRCKYEMILQQQIGGVGYWALGYDNGYSALWDLIEEYFSVPVEMGEGYISDPIEITSFPYSDSKDTSSGGFRYFNYYSCNTDLAEYGREFVYEFDVCQSGIFSAQVNDAAGLDPDIHLLSELSEAACIDRAHTDLSTSIVPGKYYVVIDTYVDNAVELEGVYTFNANFNPDNGTSPCPDGTVCDSGLCVCDTGGILCNGTCTDVSSDNNNCGSCGVVCTGDTICIDSVCESQGTNNDAGVDSEVDSETDSEIQPDAESDADSDVENPECDSCSTTYNCACRQVGTGNSNSQFPLIFLLGFTAFALRFRKKIHR